MVYFCADYGVLSIIISTMKFIEPMKFLWNICKDKFSDAGTAIDNVSIIPLRSIADNQLDGM